MNKKTDRELIAEKNYAELYNRYIPMIQKHSFKIDASLREDFMQEAYFSVAAAVDGADLTRNFNSFGTLLYNRLQTLCTTNYKISFNFQKEISFDPVDTEDVAPDGIYGEMVSNHDSEIYAYSVENYMTSEDEEKLEDTYALFLKSLKPNYRRYLELKMAGKTRKEIASEMQIRETQVSHLSYPIKAAACEIFNIDYYTHRNASVARRALNDNYKSTRVDHRIA